MPNAETVVLISCIFLFAGWVKGVVGMGLPTVAMGTLGLAMQPVHAAALVVIPSLVTNVWQFLSGPAARVVARRIATMLVLVCVGTALGVQFLTSGNSRWPAVALGSVLAAYGLVGLFLPRLAVSSRGESSLSPAVGLVTGILTGATGVAAVPSVPYLSALGFTRDELIQALGLSFTVSTAALAVGLGVAGSYSNGLALTSAAAVVPALAGMSIGQAVRRRIEPAAFRRWFFVAMVLVGAYMAVRGILVR